MAGVTSTITSKWQVTLPEDVRKEFPLKIGQRIAWEVEGDKLIGRRVRSLGELAGCLKSDDPPGDDDQGSFAQAAVARHARITRQKR
jgi:bifunctional DNA-binding transcriptional regulator/antitoxin component of YhaV-PrlF toxin-antitoxin module